MITKNNIGRIGALRAIASLFRGCGLVFILSFLDALAPRRAFNARSVHYFIISLLQLFIISISASAQTIGGNVYGGGNRGDVGGKSTVTVNSGVVAGNVFAGARMANVGERTFVNIDGEHASADILLNGVYGGNDISGTIGTSGTDPAATDAVPTELTQVKRVGVAADATNPKKNKIDNSWNTYVRTTRSTNELAGEATVIGSLYGGGNGEYGYVYIEDVTTGTGDDAVTKEKYNVFKLPRTTDDTPIATIFVEKGKPYLPELGKTYLELKGGLIAHTYGGGNNATVTGNTTIYIENESGDLQEMLEVYAGYLKGLEDPDDEDPTHHHTLDYYINTTFDRLKDQVKLSTFQSSITNKNFNMARVFGGNNKADMAIRPIWNVQSGKIRDIYSGGNEGRMTNEYGLLLNIEPQPVKGTGEEADETKNNKPLEIFNVYGGCRRSDVKPSDASGRLISAKNIEGYKFPSGLSARTLVKGGQITNVYGGNDISGRVYGGSAVGIYTSISGDVYGGGNGSYAYTDNPTLGAMDEYRDFYYNPTNVRDREREESGDDSFVFTTDKESVEALNIFRPNAEQVSVRLLGTDAEHPTIIGGSVYVGGNSASLRPKKDNPLIELKMGSYVIANNVFLGNNGEKMVDESILELYAKGVDDEEATSTITSANDYSTLDLTVPGTFADYMEGVVTTRNPRIVFDKEADGDPEDYIDFTSKIGSFFCGGNVGSMAIPEKNTYEFNRSVIIYDKLVGGCNNADVAEGTYNAAYEGGILGSTGERESYTDGDGKIKDRLELNLSNVVIQPMRWNDTFEKVTTGTTLTPGREYYYTDLRSSRFIADGTEVIDTSDPKKTYYELTVKGTTLEWNTANWNTAKGDFMSKPNASVDADTRLLNGNVYGGCYNSGHVNGNVTININQDLIKKGDVFGTGNSGVSLENQREDLLSVAMSVFGGGYGKATEIWGSTTMNHNNGYCFQIFGGGEKGVIGKKDGSGNYVYNPDYSTTVNLKGVAAATSDTDQPTGLAEAEYLYGGGNEGDVCGNTTVNLGNGRIYDSFGGASDANILGHSETYIGRIGVDNSGNDILGFPWVRDIVYGANDFGGKILSKEDFKSRLRVEATEATDESEGTEGTEGTFGMVHGAVKGETKEVLKANSYVEYLQGHVDWIFGGNYGDYDYTNPDFAEQASGSKPHIDAAFVNFRPNSHSSNSVNKMFGGGEGHSAYRESDKMQNSSYVLVDIPDGIENFRATEVFGAGNNHGVGMGVGKDKIISSGIPGEGEVLADQASAIIDLVSGQIANAIGGSYNEGVTRRTVVNVPDGSTIWMYSDEADKDANGDKNVKEYGNIFGGAYGNQILPPCDVYESNVNYNSSNAVVNGYIFGGNNNERRTLYTKVNILSPVWSHKDKAVKGYTGTVFGAGRGKDTWAEYTEVNLEDGAKVYEVYGGGMMGHVLNAESVQKYMQLYSSGPSDEIATKDPFWKDSDKWTLTDGKRIPKTTELQARWDADWGDAWTLGDYFSPDVDSDGDGITDSYDYTKYVSNAATNLTNSAYVTVADMDDRDYSGYSAIGKERRQFRYNTNVNINKGATVANYAYGGGYGKKAASPSDDNYLTGDVYGTTYIALLGGTVTKDIYAAGTSGGVYDLFGVRAYDASTNPNGYTASANAYIKGGSCRNVYGGGWLGNVGNHSGDIKASPAGDIPGETHVVIGINQDDLPVGKTSEHYFYNGIPTVQRNAYGGGEGGAVYGTAYLTLENGYVGYQFNASGEDDSETEGIDEHYEEKIEDDTKTTPNTFLTDAGCLFGGGYIDNSIVDKTYVNIYGGHVRNSAFGGGEIAAIGRGSISKSTVGGKTTFALEGIYRPGKTNIEMYGGQVHRNVFGGGRGYDNLGGHGSLYSDGYIFGQTEVHIHGGEIGTTSGVEDGDGNVFGGCDIGYVYSAYENKPDEVETLGSYGKGVKAAVDKEGLPKGEYYFQHAWADEGAFVMNGTEKKLTEDCKVLIEPHCKALDDVSIGSTDYKKGDYVSIDDLNTLKNKNTSGAWSHLDLSGIIIHNAVFAGGNTPSGSTKNANTASVFGNATASIHDIYHRDMITLGTRHTGGLYGDGNLTLVDGYRELNITNYGTDYYSIAKEIKIEDYHALPKRERDYYELKYTCLSACQDKEGTSYKKAVVDEETGTVISKASTLTADEMQTLFVIEVKDAQGNPVMENGKPKKVSVEKDGVAILIEDPSTGEWIPNPVAGCWEESGVLPVYAGRLMNSIQRADFCGVFGSRMVMQGAKDRVPEEADYTNYTINRVREVSLNKMTSTAGDAVGSEGYEHGNYFGIYNVVNYLGALTSDVDFSSERVTDNIDKITYGPEQVEQLDGEGNPVLDEEGNPVYINKGDDLTYYDWKAKHIKDKTRNNGNSHNKVALASGVYLEITTEESMGTDLYEKVWGPITGVVELDLINVAPGIGGGFVYAQNLHGERSPNTYTNTTLTALNDGAVTQWDYTYTDNEGDADKSEWQTSGNFVHSTQTIIDDCYNISNKYKTHYNKPDGVPAHFWYIKGSVYVYDQYISAYTGIPNAYSEEVDIPLTIAAASHGKMTLLNVQPNLYAFYASPGVELKTGKKVVINDKAYYKNDPISYWDWYLLSPAERELFVPETYVNCVAVNIDNEENEDGDPVVYAPGTYIMRKEAYDSFGNEHTYKDADGKIIKDADDNVVNKAYIFRSSNIVSHDTGYMLTYKVNNPSIWDTWYTEYDDTKNKSGVAREKSTDESSLESEVISGDKKGPNNGPTYHLDPTKIMTSGIVLGQVAYDEGDIISKNIEDTYTAIKSSHPTAIPNYNLSEGDDGYDADNKQATFEKAYYVTSSDESITINGETYHLNPGAIISESQMTGNSITGYEEAYICTHSIQLSKEEIIYKDSRMKKSDASSYVSGVKGKMNTLYTPASGTASELKPEEIKELEPSGTFTSEKQKELLQLAYIRDDLEAYLVPAYYCTDAGKYGGNYYEGGKNYRGLEAWSSLPEDHDKFIFNYDALDLLIDPTYRGAEAEKYQYDSAAGTEAEAKKNLATLYTADDAEVKAGTKQIGDVKTPGGYSIETSVDYTATYNGSEGDKTDSETGEKYKETAEAISGGRVYVDEELTRDEFESLPNEQRHYSSIVVQNGKKDGDKYIVYVVNTPFQVGATPYAVGEVISSETYTGLPEKDNVTTLKFDAAGVDKDTKYYYCRESYPMGTTVTPIASSVVTGAGGGISDDNKVQLGTLISSGNYGALPNEQKNFTIHGISPTETSTLYVSRESDIYDLSKDKIITVIYRYDYDELDASGNVTPISERHVLNIHLSFKSGVPTVEDIAPPDIILPGDLTILREPNVTPGAYEVTGGGWELFETDRDAESHNNGIDYNPAYDPLYWYQDGFYVAYYAKSYLGRTYSNYVPVRVANYHDIAAVMSDANKEHHMYIDHKGVKRDSKIYIKDYSGSGKDGLDHFKSLYDLSLRTEVATSGDLKDHALLDDRVKGGNHLEFFMRTDISRADDPEVANEWTPIASGSDPCFSGILHGDGHTISGLDNSLFGHLCGDVYNLGVTGSFTSAGVADDGDGYVESCWVKTTGTTPLGTKPYPVFGEPSETKECYQVVNSYVWDGNRTLYKDIPADGMIEYDKSKGIVHAMPERAFYNGELAYDLNNFYLYKRYTNNEASEDSDVKNYRYFTIGDDNSLVRHDYRVYENKPEFCSTGFVDEKGKTIHYVEDRFADGDFRYAGGIIPSSVDERHVDPETDETGKETEPEHWLPIYPDDYIFFGQKLTYGYSATQAHQDVPTAVVRDGGRLSLEANANRVYRAPAYYRNSTMDMAHFNPQVYLAQKEYLTDKQITDGIIARKAYPHLTAIDFAGHNDTHEEGTEAKKHYELGFTDGKFYPPLLDDDGLQSIVNIDETKNLLVYAPAETASEGEYANEKTYGVLKGYFYDPEYTTYYTDDKYRKVGSASDEISSIYGHLLEHEPGHGKPIANNDHLLVDKQDFNCPIAYDFASGFRMWYQRYPEDTEYVNHETGWQGISIPFTAELVTTDDKGEITHFYSGSENSTNNPKAKIGHEYWLREFKDINTEDDPAVATFDYPDAAGKQKDVTNTYLWDYYYKESSRKDANSDIYQEYYRSTRSYPSYPLLSAATPYLLGLPGDTYYEFDLSGNFTALNTYASIPKLGKQTITFASDKGVQIGVSDDEMKDITQSYNGSDYTFKPSYLNWSPDDKDYDIDYNMNGAGNAYVKLEWNTAPELHTFADADQLSTWMKSNYKLYTDAKGFVEATTAAGTEETYYKRVSPNTTDNDANGVTPSQSAFRPYFIAAVTSSSGVKEYKAPTRSIVFSRNTTEIHHQEEGDDISNTGELIIRSKRGRIIVTSTLSEATDVTIVTSAGALVDRYTIQPGETIETSVNASGVYIVNKKKIAVKIKD